MEPCVIHRLLPAIGPGLLIAVGYVDPGKWAATIDGGARFGYDLLLPLLVFNMAAILCQYLGIRITVATGKDLARIYSEEYDKLTCLFLGVQAAVSAIILDLTLVLGFAHGLNFFFGMDLSTGIILTTADAVLFPVFATFMERGNPIMKSTCMAGLVLVIYCVGVLTSQTEVEYSLDLMVTKLSEESSFALMSLLGASIMPHNFYLHSSLVLQQQGTHNISKDVLCQNQFFAIFIIFSGICLVNYVLMNSAAYVFNSAGLYSLTFPDAISLMEQVFTSPVASIAFLAILYLTNQIVALTWNRGGQGVVHGFLNLDIPTWLQHATIRVFAVVPPLVCIWTSGIEGLYQLLICTQIIIALLLPSSVIPLFRVASSKPIMGIHKISQVLEFTALVTFMGFLGLKIIFVAEMIFGNSDWAANLRLSMGSSPSIPYVALLVTACSSFCLMLWLAATPMKTSTDLDSQVLTRVAAYKHRVPVQRQELFLPGATYEREELIQNPEQVPETENSTETDFPVAVEESDEEIHLIKENRPDANIIAPSVSYQQQQPLSSGHLLEKETVKMVPVDVVGEKDEDEGDAWEPEESSRPLVPGSIQSMASDGPPSFRSLSGKSDDGGNGSPSLSRLSGLGRAARRQFASLLDEFWGQLYDFHGQPTPEARNKKLDVLLAPDSKMPASLSSSSSSPLKIDDSGRYYSPLGGRRTESLLPTRSGSSSLWSSPMQLLDAYVQSSSQNIADASDRPYSSVRNLPISKGWDSQPATVHGYQIASIFNRLAKERSSGALTGQLEPPAPLSPVALGLRPYRDPLAIALAQKLQNGLPSSPQASVYQNYAAPGNNSLLQSDRSYFDAQRSGTGDNSKKYHSSPDISGLFDSYGDDVYMPENSATQWDNTIGYGASVGRTNPDPSVYSRSPLSFNNVSKGYVDSFPYPMSSDNGSIWSKQPYENFGIPEKNRAVGSGLGSRSNSVKRETLSAEAQLLQSFRRCIVKLLKLEGSEWLFRHNGGVDEELIDRVAARERCLFEVERVSEPLEPDFLADILDPLVPNCGEVCVWKADLVVSFGVWCIHRILVLSLNESRPELWGKYTYVLNRLQGIIDPAFSKPRCPMLPCFCLEPSLNRMVPPGRGQCTTATMVLDIIKEVESAISGKKGRSGTAAGDVAFPKGKENLASVLKRYKHRLSAK